MTQLYLLWIYLGIEFIALLFYLLCHPGICKANIRDPATKPLGRNYQMKARHFSCIVAGFRIFLEYQKFRNDKQSLRDKQQINKNTALAGGILFDPEFLVESDAIKYSIFIVEAAFLSAVYTNNSI